MRRKSDGHGATVGPDGFTIHGCQCGWRPTFSISAPYSNAVLFGWHMAGVR